MATPVFERKRELVAGMLPVQRNVQVSPMPTFQHIDTKLDGTLRFAYAVGNSVSTMVSRNTFTLFEAAVEGSVNLTCLWLGLEDISNCLVILDGKESLLVKSQRLYTIDKIKFVEYTLESSVKFNHVAGVTCAVEAFEVATQFGAAFEAGSQIIQLSSKKPICVGDNLAKLVSTDFNAVLSTYIKVASVTEDSTVGSYKNYTLVLDEPLPFELVEGDRVFVKALPAYSSNRKQLDVYCSHGLLDLNCGKTFGLGSPDIALNASFFDVTGRFIYSKLCELNEVISFSAIKVQELACFQKQYGSLLVDDTKLLVTMNEDGKASIGIKLHKSNLNVSFRVSGKCKFLYQVGDTSGSVDVDSSYMFEYVGSTSYMVFRFLAEPGAVIVLTNVIASNDRIHSVEYTAVFNSLPGESVESTGLIVKPLFRSSLDCRKTSYLMELNSGYIL